MKYGYLIVLLLMVGGSFLLLGMDRKKPKLSGTTWQFQEILFVADAGNETITYVLEFTSNKKVVVKESAYMPPYPAMRMNSDGTVATEPGWHSSNSKDATYSFRRNILTITFEDGTTDVFFYRDVKLVGLRRTLSNTERVFEMVQK